MPARKQQPFTVKVWGESHYVVHRGKGFWVSQLRDGTLVSHAGNLLDGQKQHKTITTPKPCSKCKQPCWTTTPRGRAIHDTCEGFADVMPDEVHWAVVFGIAADLGATLVTGNERPEEVRRAA